jgi:hypothetical protein
VDACRTSGVTDHFAQNDEHAIEIARSIVANLNWHDAVSYTVGSFHAVVLRVSCRHMLAYQMSKSRYLTLKSLEVSFLWILRNPSTLER